MESMELIPQPTSTPVLPIVSSKRVVNLGDVDPTLHDLPSARVVFIGVRRTWGIWTPRCLCGHNWRVTNVGGMDPSSGVS